MADWYERLFAKAAGLEPLVTAVVHPVGEASIKGAIDACEAKMIIPYFVGPADRMLAAAKRINIDLSKYKIINTKHSGESAEVAAELARTAEVEALMKGKIHTDELMHVLVARNSGLRTARRMSHVFVIEVPYYKKPLFITDAAINIFPDLAAKKDIVQNAIDLFIALGFGTPKVAILSATENVNAAIPSTLDATALCKMSDRGQITGGIIDGPLAYDLAVSEDSARIKGIKSEVAGDADILVAPEIESGNMLYKQLAFLAKAESAGIVLGATVPIILASRSSEVESQKASCAMALLCARRKKLV